MEESGFREPLWLRRCLATVLLGLLPLGMKSQPSLAQRCPDPGHPTHGLVQALQKEYTVGSTVTFLCEPGFRLVGHNTSDCVLRGTDAEWNNMLPTCELIECENPVIEHGIISDELRHPYRYGDNVTIECNIGYFMIGSYLSHCEENRTWYPDLPSCKEIDPRICGAPFVSRASVHPLQSNYTIGMIISVTCNPNYSFLDETIEMSTVCEGYNLWTPPVQPCLIRTSPDSCELAINHGKIIQGKKNNYEPGDNVTIQCSAGYTLVGPSEIRYIGGKRWLPRTPSCSLSFVFIFLIVACVLVLLYWPAQFVYMKYCSL